MRFIKPIYAHCDGPCGHYETDTLKNSVQTCRKLIEKILALPDSDLDDVQARQQYVRLTMIKEEHAQICKQQIYILWSDYFKPAHYATYPRLMHQLQRITQICSQVKQTLDLELVRKLDNEVQQLDMIFSKTQEN